MILVSKFLREVANTMEASHSAFVDLIGEDSLRTEDEEVRFVIHVTLLLLRDAAHVLRDRLTSEQFVDGLMKEQDVLSRTVVEEMSASNAPHKHAESLARRMEEDSKDVE